MSLPLKYKLYKKKNKQDFWSYCPLFPQCFAQCPGKGNNKCSSNELMKAHPENRASGVIMTYRCQLF